MDHQRDRGDDDTAASRTPAAPTTGSIDAQDVGASLDTTVFDSVLSFLENLDDLNDSLLDDTEFLEPAPLFSASHTTRPGADATVIVDACGGAGIQQQELLVKPLGSHENEKPANTAGPTKDRQKQELEYLRSQLVELEAELAQLKSSPDSSSSTLVEPSPWEKIAKRQSEAKQKATIENAKLRELLEGQLKVARSLEKLLNKRALCERNDSFTERKRLRPTQLTDASAILSEIRGRIHLQFDDVDAVMEACGLSVIYTDLDEAQATTRGTTDDCVCLEMMVANVLPFPVDQVAEAMWQCLSANHTELLTGYIDASPRSEHTCDLHAAVEIKLRRAETLVQAHGVGARLTEAERSIIVFEAAGATQDTLLIRDPIRCRERGYIVIEKNVMARDGITSPSTIIKVCVHLWPEGASSGGEKTAGSVHFGSFIDLVIGSYNQNIKTMLQHVENTLLEQSSQAD